MLEKLSVVMKTLLSLESRLLCPLSVGEQIKDKKKRLELNAFEIVRQ